MEKKYNILWIEDDTDIIGSIVKPLQRMGHNIDTVETKADFLCLKNELNKYDLVLLDLIIPQKNGEEMNPHPGFDVLKIIRDELKSKIPVIIFTVVKESNHISKLEPYAVSKVLYKPITRTELTDTVLSILKEEDDES